MHQEKSRMMDVIEIENLFKNYGKLRALNNIILRVTEGNIYGLVGPNGAGKTTLIKLMVGVMSPTAGRIKVLGSDPYREKWKLRRHIGYMPQAPALYDDLSAKRNIMFFGSAQRVMGLEEKTEKILHFAQLTGRANDLVRTLSGGMKKRVSLCCALIHQPKMVFLDEPTAAIDPRLKLQLWNLFRQLARSGVTLFISTHLMDEALLCDTVTILRDGEIIAVDSPQKLLERGKTKLKFSRGGEITESTIYSTPESLAKELHRFGLSKDITSVSFQPQSIEDIILGIIGEKENTGRE